MTSARDVVRAAAEQVLRELDASAERARSEGFRWAQAARENDDPSEAELFAEQARQCLAMAEVYEWQARVSRTLLSPGSSPEDTLAAALPPLARTSPAASRTRTRVA